MEKRLNLITYGKQLWTRDLARKIWVDIAKAIDEMQAGDVIVIDVKDVEVFDYSFANELFGKAALRLPKEYPEKFVVVENLTKYTRENLTNALGSLGLIMAERRGGKSQLMGKVHPADQKTFDVIADEKGAITANVLKDKLGINLTATNERLTKLSEAGLIWRKAGVSSAGRQQYEYSIAR